MTAGLVAPELSRGELRELAVRPGEIAKLASTLRGAGLPELTQVEAEKLDTMVKPLAALPPGALRATAPTRVGWVPATLGVDWATPRMSDTSRVAQTVIGALAKLGAARPSLIQQLNFAAVKNYIPEVGYYRGWSYVDRTFNDAPFEVAGDAVDLTRAWLERATREAPPVPAARLKKFTNHGDPTWGSSMVDHAAHLLLASKIRAAGGDPQSTVEFVDKHANRTGLPDEPVMTTFSRSGMTAKEIPVIDLRADGPYIIAKSKRIFCRRRCVRGLPTYVNEAIRPGVHRLQRWLKTTPEYGHGAQQLMERRIFRASLGKQVYSDDASQFDLTASADAIACVRKLIGKHMDPVSLAALNWSDRIQGLVGPPQVGALAGIQSRKGTVVSGVISTTLEGTVLNYLVVVDALLASAPKRDQMRDSIKDGSTLILVQGDDSLIMTPFTIDEAKYKERALSLGLTRKLERFPVFLARYYNVEMGVSHNIAGRAFVRSLSRERAAAGPYSELMATMIRWSLCARDPFCSLLWNTFCDTAQTGAWLRARGWSPGNKELPAVVNLAMAELQAAGGARSFHAELEEIEFTLGPEAASADLMTQLRLGASGATATPEEIVNDPDVSKIVHDDESLARYLKEATA